MNTESQKLIETVSNMRDEDLLQMVHLDSVQYLPEALTYAKAEISKRGISFNQTDLINSISSIPDLPFAAFGRSLWKARRLITFGVSFGSSLACFAWANFDSYRSSCEDCAIFFGFPFNLYQAGGFGGPTTILWGGLIADIAISILVSAVVGWLLKTILSKWTV
jgi:hypothetical protein